MRLKCHLLVGEAPAPAVADRVAELFAHCPYVHFAATFEAQVVVVFYLPPERTWWAAGIANDPAGTLGLTRAAVYVTDRPAHPSERSLQLPQKPLNRAPCGSDCAVCPHWGEQCLGCPAWSGHRRSVNRPDWGA